MTKDDAIYSAFCEIIPFTKDEVTVQVESGADEYGDFVKVHWEDKKSSKIRYETDKV